MSNKTSAKGASVYDNRKLQSIPAPLEEDSDSDFNPGSYEYELPKRGRGRKGPATTTRVKRGRRNDALEFIDAGPPRKKAKRQHVSTTHNPLLEYFDESLGLEVASSDDETFEKKTWAEEDEELEDQEEEEEDVSAGEQLLSSPVRPNHFALFRAVASQPTQSTAINDSETESDDGNEASMPTIIRASSQVPKAAPVRNDDDSATESDSEADVTVSNIQASQAGRRIIQQSTEVDDSATESDSGAEDYSKAPHPEDVDAFWLDKGHGIRVPRSLNKYLRDYQREGVKFFYDCYVANRGAILGDDMGLGKTIQVISFLSAIMHKVGTKEDRRRRRDQVSELQDQREWRKHRKLPPADATWATALIVVPTSVVGVWEAEFRKWAHFEVGSFQGHARNAVLNDFKMGRLDVVITSFDTALRSIELIESLPWSVLIVDEAHRLKNPNSKTTTSLSEFAWAPDHPIPSHISQLNSPGAQADQASSSRSPLVEPRTGPMRIALTGTAIQNSYLELWTLLNWANPGMVGSINQWKGFVVKPLTIGQAKGCTEEERLRANLVAQTLKEKLLPNFFIRRTKDIIKHQLPKKTDEVVFCPLTKKQVEVYKRILNLDDVQNMIRKDERCDCGSQSKRKDCCHPFKAGDLFKYMSTLIKISNHLVLILPSPKDTPEQTMRNRELAEVAFPHEPTPKYGPSMLLSMYCGKWMVLETLLHEWRKDAASKNKVLIFTKSVKLLEMLEFHLNNNSYGFVKLDGSIQQHDRGAVIEKFQKDPDIFVFLISTLAGGTGLNLTAANKVVVFDPNWNPAHDLQAMDRAYRFGQTRDVSVYRLLGAGSIEELIYARQVYKQQQMAIGYEASVQTRYFSGVSGDKSRQGELFGLQNIFKLHENSSTTKMAIERANLINLDWALAHMDTIKSKRVRKKKGTAEEWVYEAEVKDSKEDAELKGLGALLLDDSVPEVEESDVSKILNSHGIKYSHRNTDILAPSNIEKAKIQTVLKEKRRQAKEAEQKKGDPDTPPQPEWPPRRRHHKPPPSPKSKWSMRQVALIDLGMIQTADDLPLFASDFAKKSQEEQQEILAMLDAHGK